MNVATASLAYESTKSDEPNMMKSRFAALDTDNEEMNSSNDKATNGAREITNEDYNNNLSKTSLNSKAEVIEAVEQRKKSNNLVPSRNEPPDHGSPKNMADCEETCITMEMDSSDKVEPNGSGIIVPSLQGSPLPNSQ
ncbi:hypothetical protein RIF29_39822 [Crotalaria pallida]|uniref:Uncharacterized protein n=1 Tax=Crotalaria pallida TaxID=3830 RepID=A0AAN9E1Z3_CROPI